MNKYEVHVNGRLKIINKIVQNTPRTFDAYYYNHRISIITTGTNLLVRVTTPQGQEIERRKDYKASQKDVAIKNCVTIIADNYNKVNTTSDKNG